MWILNELFEIVLFPRKTTGTDKFYQAIIIDQNTVWMHISYFYVIFLKLYALIARNKIKNLRKNEIFLNHLIFFQKNKSGTKRIIYRIVELFTLFQMKYNIG